MIGTNNQESVPKVERGIIDCEQKDFLADFDLDGWDNLLSLGDSDTVKLLAQKSLQTPLKKPRLLVIFEGSRVLKAYHSEKGPIQPDFGWNGPEHLEEILHSENAQAIVAIEQSAMGRIYNRFQQRANLRGEFVNQLIEIYDSIRLEAGSGLYFYPPRRLEPIRQDPMQKIIKLVIRANSTILFYLFDGNEIWTSVIIGIKNGNVELFTSHNALVAKNVTIANWREDYKKIVSAVTGLIGRPSVGFFSDLRAFAEMSRARRTLRALMDARKRRDIIIEPLPVRIKTMLSAGRFIGL